MDAIFASLRNSCAPARALEHDHGLAAVAPHGRHFFESACREEPHRSFVARGHRGSWPHVVASLLVQAPDRLLEHRLTVAATAPLRRDRDADLSDAVGDVEAHLTDRRFAVTEDPDPRGVGRETLLEPRDVRVARHWRPAERFVTWLSFGRATSADYAGAT